MDAPVELRVFDCVQCGAPLPAAADGAHVTCAFCQHAQGVKYDGAAMVREQASRREAEALYAKLGQPPSLSQRVAVALTNKWLWILGLPFMLAALVRVGQIPAHLLDAIWEKSFHARLLHVAPPVVSWVLGVGWQTGVLVFLLVWSLFGERIDARRELQKALSSKPPRTPGGPALCRHCDAALAVPEGALGARCTYCGADNLLQVPAEWVASAKKIDASLRLGAKEAKQRAAEGARRVRSAATWRLPIVGMVVALVAWPLAGMSRRAGWRDMRYEAGRHIGVFQLAVWHEHEMPTPEVRAVPACDDSQRRSALRKDATLTAGDTQWCEGGRCETVAVLALAHGEHLRLDSSTTAGPVGVRLALGDRDYAGGVAVLGEGFGDEVATKEAANGVIGATLLEAPIVLSGWYKLSLAGPHDAAVEVCVVPR